MRVEKVTIGSVFCRLTVIKRSLRKKHVWCRCECGTLSEVRRGSLTNGTTKSCGCLRSERAGARWRNTKPPAPKDRKAIISHDRLLERLIYDPTTGVFTWRGLAPTDDRSKAWNTRFSGKVAGSISKQLGYRGILIDGRLYYAHRLAWFYVHGKWPAHETDHIDRNRDNNAIANLREATIAQNARNRGKAPTNTSGVKGVSWSKATGKWWAQFKRNGIHHNLGHFVSKAEAAKIYADAVARFDGEFANTGERQNG